MKPYPVFGLLPFLMILTFTTARACDNSEISLVSYTNNGSSHDYVIEICIGGGILGVNTGATANTGTFAIGMNAGGNALTISNPTASITSDETMTTFNASVQGPQGDPFNIDGVILYFSTSGDPYTCITSTAQCGEPYIDCKTISFTTDVVLESIIAFGIEGNGNPVAGCTGDPDMTIDLLSLPVTLTRFVASEQDGQVTLNWETATEVNNDFFAVERSLDGKTFELIGRVAGNNTTTEITKYQFVDQPYGAGQYYYRLRQVDFSGEFRYSPIIAVWVAPRNKEILRMHPNPTMASLHLFSTDIAAQSVRIEIYDHLGQLVLQGIYPWNNQLVLPTVDYASGLYILHLYAGKQLIEQKRFMKM